MQISTNAHSNGWLSAVVARPWNNVSFPTLNSLHRVLICPKNIIWRQPAKLQQQSVTDRSGGGKGRKNYRVFSKQQQYQKIFEREKKRMKRTKGKVLLEANNLLFCCLLINLKDFFCSHLVFEIRLSTFYLISGETVSRKSAKH